MTRPKSASGIWTGLSGIVGCVAAIVLLHDWQAAPHLKTMAVVGLCAAIMIAVDVAVHRAIEQSGLAAQPAATNWQRIIQKLIGLWATFGLIGLCYWLLPIYADGYYRPFFDALLVMLPALVVASPVYIWFVDRRQASPEDAYVEIARLISGTVPRDWNVVFDHLRAWTVKGFFLPLMFVFLNSDLANLWSVPLVPTINGFHDIYDHLYDGIYLFDVLLASVGYLLTLKLFGSEIRSAEPTLWGWLVCLACYPPFWAQTSQYFSYDQDNTYWGNFFGGNPILYPLWGSIILVLVAIYVWATASFGIRFSNLTHRGIITSGPYRWVKHPAYLSKNLSWWLISMPFIAGTGDWSMAVRSSVLLAGVNLIYFFRAVTEERHLSRDPVYREYQAYIAEHGLLAVVRRLWARKSTPIAKPPNHAELVDK